MPGTDNAGVFRRLSRQGRRHGQHLDQRGRGDPDRSDGQPRSDDWRVYLEQAADAAKRDAALKPAGQWNSYEIQVNEDRIIVILNGVKINEWIDDDPVSDLKQGRIGLQMHGSGDDVYFRNVRVGKLGASVSADHTISGSVPATLGLTFENPSSSFGTFPPNVDKTYEITSKATVNSTAGDATLSVTPDPAFLANGSYTLSEPLQVAFSKSAWTGPVSLDPVDVTFRQHIGAKQPLRTGEYRKSLTFTLSTTTP